MTRILVLGLLDVQPMSGYDIQQMLRISDAERWGGRFDRFNLSRFEENGKRKSG